MVKTGCRQFEEGKNQFKPWASDSFLTLGKQLERKKLYTTFSVNGDHMQTTIQITSTANFISWKKGLFVFIETKV